MGNNRAFTYFEETTVLLYDEGVLTPDLLNKLGEQWRDTDIDMGGYQELAAKDGKNLLQILVALMMPGEVDLSDGEAVYEAFDKIREKWGWY